MYRIAQLTDIHIGNAEDETFDVDVRGNFKRVLAQAVRDGVDEVLVTGDLAFRSGEPAIYAWIAQTLGTLSIPWHVLPGNHDDVAMMKVAFADRAYCDNVVARDLEGRSLLFVDSGPSRVSDAQLEQLRIALGKAKRTPLVFLHHPPFALGAPFMDEGHMLENHEEVFSVLCEAPVDVAVFCGHYHIERTVKRASVATHATPSTFFQIDPRHQTFVVDHRVPAYRSIAFDENMLQTAVHWCFAPSSD